MEHVFLSDVDDAGAAAGATAGASPLRPTDSTTKQYFNHASAPRVNTEAVIARSLKKQYPNLSLTIARAQVCNLLAYAATGNAACTPVQDDDGEPSSLSWKMYVTPARRLNGSSGAVVDELIFGKFLYQWKGHDFIVYLADGRDGDSAYPAVQNFYILSSQEQKVEDLILDVGRWTTELGEEVWVFDAGFWERSPELYQSVMKANWESVILDPDMKKSLIEDHLSFFRSRDTYAELKIPWKRGIIYYGPPGNGKTISIKAMMHTLYELKSPVPTLYVRSLASYMGPEYSLQEIFGMARRLAPCYLVFEDLDSVVSDNVRSYFLNEVDGLENNDGIFMIGSTNHLERLDPGISKRPSRFDRKYLFPNPNEKERIAYCHFWQAKLASNKSIDFPDRLCDAIAGITDKFSFAYMQEAFVASLLAIAREETKSDGPEKRVVTRMEKLALSVDRADDWVEILDGRDGGDADLDGLVLWVAIKKQIEILREGLSED